MKKIEVAAVCLALTTVYPGFSAKAVTRSGEIDAETLSTQVLLDRLGFGPGVIDVTSANSMPAGNALRVRKSIADSPFVFETGMEPV